MLGWVGADPAELRRYAAHESGHTLGAVCLNAGFIRSGIGLNEAGAAATVLEPFTFTGSPDDRARLCRRIVVFQMGLAVDAARRERDWRPSRFDLDVISRMASSLWPRCIRDSMLGRLRRVADELAHDGMAAIDRLAIGMLEGPYYLDHEAACRIVGREIEGLRWLTMGEIEAVARLRVVRRHDSG
jgi:hypothetical protein